MFFFFNLEQTGCWWIYLSLHDCIVFTSVKCQVVSRYGRVRFFFYFVRSSFVNDQFFSDFFQSFKKNLFVFEIMFIFYLFRSFSHWTIVINKIVRSAKLSYLQKFFETPVYSVKELTFFQNLLENSIVLWISFVVFPFSERSKSFVHRSFFLNNICHEKFCSFSNFHSLNKPWLSLL